MEVEVDPTEDTEWNDILREHKIIPEKEPTADEIFEEILDSEVDRRNNLNIIDKTIENNSKNKNDEESILEELEDEINDDKFMESYRLQRLNELKNETLKRKGLINGQKTYGSVIPVSKPEYSKEITEESKFCDGVIVHLSDFNNNIQSKLLTEIFNKAAAKYPTIKFVDIPASRAIENYPEKNIPTILIYKNGELSKQIITLFTLNGLKTTLSDLESLLVENGIISESDPRLEAKLEKDEDNDDQNNNDNSDDDW